MLTMNTRWKILIGPFRLLQIHLRAARFLVECVHVRFDPGCGCRRRGSERYRYRYSASPLPCLQLQGRISRFSATLPGGQTASAVVACSRWGLQTRYVGKIGDDSWGKLQQSEMDQEAVEAHWVVAPNCHSQSSFILIDESTGERTILWKRDPRLTLQPEGNCSATGSGEPSCCMSMDTTVRAAAAAAGINARAACIPG